MSNNGRNFEVPIVPPEFFENQRNFPPEQLMRYAGQYIAWSLDGAHILASGQTMEEVEEKLLAAGIKPSHVLGDFIPDTDALFS